MPRLKSPDFGPEYLREIAHSIGGWGESALYNKWELIDLGRPAFRGTGYRSSTASLPALMPYDSVVNVSRWLADQSWLEGPRASGVEDPGDPTLVRRLKKFLRDFGDLSASDRPHDTEISADAVVDRLARLKLALETALAVQRGGAAWKKELNDRWSEYWLGHGDLIDRRDQMAGVTFRWGPMTYPVELGRPPYGPAIRPRLIKLTLAQWAAAAGVRVSWAYADSDEPLVPDLEAPSLEALLFLTYAITAGAVRASKDLLTLAACDECGRLFAADRRRRRGGPTHQYCTRACGNRFRAREFRRRHANMPGEESQE